MKNNNNKNGKKQNKSSNSNSGSNGKKKVTGLKKIVILSESAVKYLRCLANPSSGPLAGIPNYPAQFSRKLRTFSRGTFDCKANGQAWIVCAPELAIASDQTSVVTVDSTGVSNAWQNYGTAGEFLQFSSNSEYLSAAIGVNPDQFEYRVVGSELKIRYIGTELDRSGQMIALMDPNHVSMFGRSLASFDQEETSRRFPVDKQWTTILYRPVHDEDTDYRSTIPVSTNAFTDEDIYYIGFNIQSPAGTPTPYEWEHHTVFEVFGKNIRGMTPSHTDVTGFSAVHAASQLGESLYPSKDKPPVREKNLATDTARYMNTQTSHVSHVDENLVHTFSSSSKDAASAAVGSIGAAAALSVVGAILSIF